MLATTPLGLGYCSMAIMIIYTLSHIFCTYNCHRKGTIWFWSVNCLQYLKHARSGNIISMGGVWQCILTISCTCIFLCSHNSTSSNRGGWKSWEKSCWMFCTKRDHWMCWQTHSLVSRRPNSCTWLMMMLQHALHGFIVLHHSLHSSTVSTQPLTCWRQAEF